MALFHNAKTGSRIVSVENVYGDEMVETLEVLYAKGCRRFVYMGTSGALDPKLNIGDVLIPNRFLMPDGSWFRFENGARAFPLAINAPATIVRDTAQGWVGTLIEETRDHIGALGSSGAQAIDVESRYFAEFFSRHPATETAVIVTVSDTPLGTATYNQENATRAIPMESITALVPEILSVGP